MPSPDVCYISRHWLHLLKTCAHPGVWGVGCVCVCVGGGGGGGGLCVCMYNIMCVGYMYVCVCVCYCDWGIDAYGVECLPYQSCPHVCLPQGLSSNMSLHASMVVSITHSLSQMERECHSQSSPPSGPSCHSDQNRRC